MKWFRNVVDFLSGAQARKEREMMEVRSRKHLDDGKTSYHSSWMTSDFGLEDFQQALTLQDKLREGDWPEKIETFVWIAKALQKQNELEESMGALKAAFRIQLQNGGLYESKTAGILDSMVAVLEGMGTTHAKKQAQIISNTLFRIKYRLYGKGFDFVDTDTSSSITDTSSITQSLFEETEGDHLFHESKEWALTKYKAAALVEYREWGSHNLNFALLHRKIALSSMSTPADFPFRARVLPKCQTTTCIYIRQGDDLLFQTRYEEATSYYLQAASTTASSPPASMFVIAWFLLAVLASLLLLFLPAYAHKLHEFKTAKKSKKTQTPSCASSKSDDDGKAKSKEPESAPKLKQESETVGKEKASLADDSLATVQGILDGETAAATSEREQPMTTQTHDEFGGSFESLGALLQQSGVVASAIEILEGESD